MKPVPVKKFSIPYNPRVMIDKELREEYFQFLERNKDFIIDVYFGYATPPFMTDARAGHINKDKHATLADIAYIKNKFGIAGSATFNGEISDSSPASYESFLKEVKKLVGAGVESMTLNAPLWVWKIKRDIPEMIVKNTVVIPIGFPQEFSYNYDEIGFDMLYVREDLIKDRDLMTLNLKIRDITGKKMGMLMNHECCLSFCPLKKTHYEKANASLQNGDFEDLFGTFCTAKEVDDIPSWYKRTEVFPLRSHYQWFYENFDYLKMVGRTVEADLIETMETVDAFCQTDSPVLYKSWFNRLLKNIKDPSKLDEFLEKHTNCKSYCALCNYCDNMTKDDGQAK